MERGLAKCLQWPSNRAALKWAHWHIYTTEASKERATKIASAVGLPITMKIVDEEWAGTFLAKAVNEFVMDCARVGDRFLMAPPDTIFGEQTLDTLISIARVPKIIVSIPPVRVNQTFLDDFTGDVTNNPQLVSLAWKHLHRTWTDADMQRRFTNSFAGGVSWHEITDGLYAVTHLLPTPYYIDPSPSDAEWFRVYGAPGAYDHLWPGKLVDEGRQRLIGSSDAGFAVELTMHDQNIPVLYPADPADPTTYIGNNKHNHVNRNTVAIFRGE